MTDLPMWLQWAHFFQPKYGSLNSFIAQHERDLADLRLLETSTHEIVRLPTRATLSSFEQELNAMRVRSAVAHLCALIIQEGLVSRFSFNVYRTSMETWFRQLSSLAMLRNNQTHPLRSIVEFLVCLPVLIGQARIVEELILGPLDEVFGADLTNGINARTRLWNLADAQQKTRLELWGHTVNVHEWKNENKWLGQGDLNDDSMISDDSSAVERTFDLRGTPTVMMLLLDLHRTFSFR